MMKFPGLLMVLLAVAAAGCHGKDRDTGQLTPAAGAAAAARPVPELALPVVPDTIRDVELRLRFVLDRFWDSMDWTDTAAVNSDDFMEQNLVNFYQLLAMADSSARAGAVVGLVNAAATANPAAVERIADISARYLYSMDSPMYNPGSYLAFIDALVASKTLPAATVQRLAHSRRALLSNREGTKAADFEFLLPDGRRTRLSHKVDRPTILMFYDSDCDVCARIEKMLSHSPAINRAVGEGRLQVIAIDTFSASKDAWAEKAAEMPRNWTVGYSPDGAVDTDEIYFILTTPSLYLLAADMTVLIKDIDDPTLRRWLTHPPF